MTDAAVRWRDFAAGAPALAAAGQRLLFAHGPGLAYLGTVTPAGSPRIHPICPVLVGGGLYGLLIPSPKRRDLQGNPRCALHSFPQAERDDEFSVAGAVLRHDNPRLLAEVLAVQESAGVTSAGTEELYEFLIGKAPLATYKERGAPDYFPPTYTRWTAG